MGKMQKVHKKKSRKNSKKGMNKNRKKITITFEDASDSEYTMTSALPGGIVDQDLENHGSSRWSNITCNYFKRKPGLRWMRRRYIMADFHLVSKEEERLLCTSLKIECKETNKQ